ncbi:Uncharacterized protein APZ42_012079 [Daphnia magna]|uniref:Uncharacterized protein n=1 Tax=Daphnia magna TaxID=35525 RepID=A0A162S2F9_9CRUS|nr:Uncharacterized protein APZ42_012079 [Daphnia magna]
MQGLWEIERWGRHYLISFRCKLIKFFFCFKVIT